MNYVEAKKKYLNEYSAYNYDVYYLVQSSKYPFTQTVAFSDTEVYAVPLNVMAISPEMLREHKEALIPQEDLDADIWDIVSHERDHDFSF